LVEVLVDCAKILQTLGETLYHIHITMLAMQLIVVDFRTFLLLLTVAKFTHLFKKKFF
jgi:hypothetical protein